MINTDKKADLHRYPRKSVIKSVLIVISALVVAGLGIFLYSYFNSKTVEAAWFDESWGYRKAINIATHTASENNVYINLTGANDLDTSDTSRFQADCGDLRFTKANGELLQYYISSGCGTVDTVVHVNFTTFPAGAQTIYYYYGNPTTSNGFQTADFSTEATNYTFTTAGIEEKSPGPVAYWKFDEGFGQTAQDSTVNNLDGTFGATTGASTDDPTWITEDQCISGKCLKFDGGDYVSMGTSSTLNPTSAMTITAWVKFNSFGTENWVVGRDKSGTRAYSFGPEGNYSNRLALQINGAATIRDISGTELNTNQWYHIAVTGDSTSGWKMYINGSLKATASWSAPDYVAETTYIGRRGYVGNEGYVNGFIDEPKIYNYAGTEAQIKADYNSKGSGSPKGDSAVLGADQSSSSLSNGLVGYWKMDETATPSLDSSGNNNSGTWNNNTYGTGKFGNATSFDGTNDYVSFPTRSSMSTGSMAFWFKPSNADIGTNAETLISHRSGAGINRTGMFQVAGVSGNKISLLVWNGSTWSTNFTTNSSVAAQQWNHIIITWDSTGKKIYINGNQDANTSTDSQALFTGVDNTWLGIAYDLNWDYTGRFDEFRIYNKALSPKEVTDLYNFAPGPVSYWNFDEGVDNTCSATADVCDKAGNNNHGTWAGTGSHWTSGKIGKAGNFNGSDDYTHLGSSGTNFPTGAKPRTISLWFKMTSSEAQQVLFGYGDMASAQELSIYYSSDTLGILTYGYTKTFSWTRDSNWHHFAAVYPDGQTSTDQFLLYLDGQLKTSTGGLAQTLNTSATYPKIGCRPGADACSGFLFGGLLDDIKIYNYARSQKQILADMSTGIAQKQPIGYWKFDEGADNLCTGGVNDVCNSGIGGSTLDGAQSGMSVPATATSGWTNNGKFGKALEFDLTDDQVAIASDIAASSITISAWVYPNTQKCNTIFSKGDGSDNAITDYIFDVGFNGTNCTTAMNVGLMAGGDWDVSASTIPLNQWTHVAVTFDGSNKYFYINGRLDVIRARSVSIYNSSNTPFIGKQGTACNCHFFDGTLDEVKFYNFILTSDEVKEDYNSGQSLVLGSLSDKSGNQPLSSNNLYCVPGDSSTCTAPVGEWSFDEGTGTSAFNRSGGGYTKTLGGDGSGTDIPIWTAGKVGKALSFDGSDDYIASPNNFTPPTGAITIEAWIKTTTNGIFAGWTDAFDSSIRDRMLFVDSANKACFYTYGTGLTAQIYVDGVLSGTSTATNPRVASSVTVNDGRWHHIVGYASGGYNSYTTPTFITGQTGDASLGAADQCGTAARYFTGQVDNVRIFNYARTPAQVAWDYNRGKPVGWWKLDECQGNTAYDASGNSLNGTITIGATGGNAVLGTCTTPTDGTGAWYDGKNGKYGSSLNFDGTDDYVSLPQGGGLNAAASGSISMWVKWSGTQDASVLANCYGPATARQSDGVFTNHLVCLTTNNPDTAKISWYPYNGLAGITGSTSVGNNAWRHIVITYASGDHKLYIDGKLDGTSATTGTMSDNSSIPLAVGAWIGGGTGYSTSTIDDVRIYNYTLTLTQIKNIMNEGAAVRFGPSTGSP